MCEMVVTLIASGAVLLVRPAAEVLGELQRLDQQLAQLDSVTTPGKVSIGIGIGATVHLSLWRHP